MALTRSSKGWRSYIPGNSHFGGIKTRIDISPNLISIPMARTLRCALLEDELPGLAYLKMMCEQLPNLEVVKAYVDPRIFLEEVPKLQLDFCILDIEMPHWNGLQVANLLTGMPVIFSTAYREYAPEAFDLNAVDYLRKPISQERLRQAVDKVRARLTTAMPSKILTLNTDRGKAMIPADQISLILTSEGDSRDKVAVLKDRSKVLLKNISLTQLLAQLDTARFVQINKREVLDLEQVNFFTHDLITSRIPDEGGKPRVLSLGEKFRQTFLEKVKS